MPDNNWHNISTKKVVDKLKTGKRGLGKEEVEKRREEYGLNKLPEKKKLGKFQIFISQFKNPLIYILLIAAGISFFLREYTDMIVILVAVAINTIIGFIQESKANEALSKLQHLVKRTALVIRDGVEKEIDAKNLVPGDVILLGAGDKVPADARLFEVNELQANEASLTGESAPIDKHTKPMDKGTVLADRRNMVYMGTVITKGKGRAIVVETGANTYLGETAALIKETPEDKTPLQERLTRLSKFIGLAVVVIAILIIIEGLIKGRDFFEIFIISVAIAVSSIPEGLTIAVTVILAIGMQRILKKGSLVRTLVAAETLGSVSVICTDKTGTLTEGKMSVTEILAGDDLLEEKLKLKNTSIKKRSISDQDHIFILTIGLLCNNAAIENPAEDLKNWKIIGDPTERALLLAGYSAGLDKIQLEKDEKRIDEVPFSSDSKYMATLNRDDKKNTIYAKGAPEKIMKRSKYLWVDGKKKKLTESKIDLLNEHYNKLTSRGLRVLALAFSEVKKDMKKITPEDVNDLVLVGFVGIKDPLRKEVKETIKLTRGAGIHPIIVTGDHKLTAKAIADEAGIKVKEKNIMEGLEIDKMGDEKFDKIITKINLFARVTPKHKIRIVDALQKKSEVVAMTGDGVNDAPAIKSADIGVALGSGTDVTKETADLVLLDNNFKTIVDAVKQGRIIFENIKKVIVYLLSDSFTEVILIGGSLLMGLPLPLLAAQILWVNLIADSFPAFALSFEKGEEEVMNDKPRPKDYPILDKEMKILIFIIGIITDLVLFAIFLYLWRTTGDLEHTRSFVFVALAIDSLFYVYSCRNFRKTIWHYNPFKNKLLNLAVFVGISVTVLSVYWSPLQSLLRTVPLNFWDWTILVGLGILQILLIEATKWVFLYKETHKKIFKKIKNK